jgi:hypothetical protein
LPVGIWKTEALAGKQKLQRASPAKISLRMPASHQFNFKTQLPTVNTDRLNRQCVLMRINQTLMNGWNIFKSSISVSSRIGTSDISN